MSITDKNFEKFKGKTFVRSYYLRQSNSKHLHRLIETETQCISFNHLIGNPMKWSNTLKQLAGHLGTNCLSVFNHFEGLAPKGLIFFK